MSQCHTKRMLLLKMAIKVIFLKSGIPRIVLLKFPWRRNMKKSMRSFRWFLIYLFGSLPSCGSCGRVFLELISCSLFAVRLIPVKPSSLFKPALSLISIILSCGGWSASFPTIICFRFTVVYWLASGMYWLLQWYYGWLWSRDSPSVSRCLI